MNKKKDFLNIHAILKCLAGTAYNMCIAHVWLNKSIFCKNNEKPIFLKKFLCQCILRVETAWGCNSELSPFLITQNELISLNPKKVEMKKKALKNPILMKNFQILPQFLILNHTQKFQSTIRLPCFGRVFFWYCFLLQFVVCGWNFNKD